MKSMRSFSYTKLFIILTFFVLLNVIWPREKAGSPIDKDLPSIYPKNGPLTPGSKWIVVTMEQYPAESIKTLAGQPGWQMVIVEDTKTPKDWNLADVHFLSLKKQNKLFGDFAAKLSTNRKNLGYLYAIMNGAEWIYEAGADIRPYGLGLSQFDYEFSAPISGLRYISKSDNISEKLFNPYRFYGFDNMWPRGFPLEYIEGHTNGKDRMISCSQLRRPAVQHGLIITDPRFKMPSGIAPPIALDSGTYSPWKSKNTLFHYSSFFIMYLPTTVSPKAGDIWWSYFGQKLLHLIGENVAFRPINAIQIDNFSSYLDDSHQGIDGYKQSGKIIEFLDKWKCSRNDIVSCTLELADRFIENNFFGREERELIEIWLKQLTHLGYIFPSIVGEQNPLILGKKYGNCKRANLDFGIDKYKTKQNTWATETVKGFGKVLKWCDAVDDPEESLPTGEEFLHLYRNQTGLLNKRDTVLVMISNPPWNPSIVGLIQRLYSPFFKATIFCGTWTDPSVDPGLLPPIEPLNFVYLTQEEIRGGYNFGYCVSKIHDIRLQNITGYFFVADDTVFNIWHDLPLDKYLNPVEIDTGEYWWRPEEIARSYDAFENFYKNDPKFGKSWWEYKETLRKTYPGKNITEHYLHAMKRVFADFFYIPEHKMEYIGNLMEVMSEAEVFVETAIGKITDGLEYNLGGHFTYLWHDDRFDQWSPYNSSIIGLHPIKLGKVHIDMEYRKMYCNTVINAFGKEIYGRKTT